MPANTEVRSSKYVNDLIEQDHRGVKIWIGPMLGFKGFRTATIAIAGVELLRRIHKPVQSSVVALKDGGLPAIWNAVLAV